MMNRRLLQSWNAGQMEETLVSLAFNAMDAMPSVGRLTISTGMLIVDDAFTRRHPACHPTRDTKQTGQGITPSPPPSERRALGRLGQR